MIYQLEILYGAKIGDKVYYSVCTAVNDCTELLEKFPNENMFKEPIVKKIKEDGLNPDDFEFGFLTKDQYENRNKPENSVTVNYKNK